ncbi:uncharacterized protein DMENIID0001_028880 [Sergentomyia squamirostris]
MGWGNLPSLVLVDIYGYLGKKDRLRASATCKQWRHTLFHPRFFENATFVIGRKHEARNQFYLQNLAQFISATTITFDSSNSQAVQRATEILVRICNVNNRLVSLTLKPLHSQFVLPRQLQAETFLHTCLLEPIKRLLGRRNPAMSHLNFGSCEQLVNFGGDFLKAMICPQEMRLLSIASIKDNPQLYYVGSLEANLFDKCTNLNLLSIDYDFLNDELLHVLKLSSLKRLILHVHSIDKDTIATSEDAWRSFQEHNPQAELRINLINANKAIKYLHSHILHESMPLTHLKVLFCKYMNPQAIDFISQHYSDTFKSFTWIDSSYDIHENAFFCLTTEQDPLVMMAWRCKKLEEIVLHGYFLDIHNLVGIARLRGYNLKRFEVAKLDLLPNPLFLSFLNEINRLIMYDWLPMTDQELHPALSGCAPPSKTTRDKYLMEVTQSDVDDFY